VGRLWGGLFKVKAVLVPDADSDPALGFTVGVDTESTAEPDSVAPMHVAQPTPQMVLEAIASVKPTPVEELDLESLLRKKIRSSTGRAFFVVDLGILREQVFLVV